MSLYRSWLGGLCLLLVVNVAPGETIRCAVKKGQQTFDRAGLPLTCFSLVTVGEAMPTENVEFENLATHERTKASFSKLFHGKEAEYLTAIDKKHRWVCIIIIALKPGRYRFLHIEFSPIVRQAIASYDCEFEKSAGFSFNVRPDCVNYIGSLVFEADFEAAHRRFEGPKGGSGPMAANFKVELTQQRDATFAASQIPCLRDLPAWAGAIDPLPASESKPR